MSPDRAVHNSMPHVLNVFNLLNLGYTTGMLSAAHPEAVNARYDLHVDIREQIVMPRPAETAQEVAARLADGQDLTPGQVAILLGVTRYGVDYWIVAGIQVPGEAERWHPEHTTSPGGRRKIKAEAVRRLIELTTIPRPRRGRRRPKSPDAKDQAE
jgi:hypothetical protein